MMKQSSVKTRWANGQIANCTLVKVKDPIVVDIVSRTGFDSIWIDLEHSEKSLETLLDLVRASRFGKADIMARPGRWEYMRMSRMLEAGAQGILYPRCESAKEAAEVVRWCKFAPIGERGFDGGGFDNDYGMYPSGDYTSMANEQTWIAVQIESPLAVENIESIAAVPGYDVLFFGPGDYSVLSGIPGQVRSEAVIRAAKCVAAVAHAPGKIFGTLVFDAEHSKIMTQLGARFLAWEADTSLLKVAYASLLKDFFELESPA